MKSRRPIAALLTVVSLMLAAAGLPGVLVPDVEGLPLGRALEILVESGLRVGDIADPEECAGEPHVYETNPAPGRRTLRGTSVQVIVARSPHRCDHSRDGSATRRA